MARAINGTIHKNRRKKVLRAARGFRGGRSKLFRTAKSAIMKAGQWAYRDRRKKKSEFRKLWIIRINAAARDEEEGLKSRESDSNWLIGKQNRHLGSLHFDIWRGPAADLASRGALAVYPALGWWKTRPRLERYNNAARYALIVSIKAPDVEVDLYNEIASQLEVEIFGGS